MSKNPTEREPDILAAIDLIQRSAAHGLMSVREEVMKLCEHDYAAVQTAMYMAYDDAALHALANTVLSEDAFVQAVRNSAPSDDILRQRWRHHAALRAMQPPPPDGFYRN